MSYLLRQANITNLAINRVHYAVKKFLAETKDLEFHWRQLWAGKSDKTDVFTHMFPFGGYDIPSTCGPDRRKTLK
uniref:Glycoside hydrolase family 38 N-terminal domain-containing protein n=1 Tax=Panagrolaimus sp. PS1159 TaxID=55785 RepID=A0AC35FW38_9BILA